MDRCHLNDYNGKIISNEYFYLVNVVWDKCNKKYIIMNIGVQSCSTKYTIIYRSNYRVEQWFTFKKGCNPFLTSCNGLLYTLKKGAKKQNGSYAARRGKLTLPYYYHSLNGFFLFFMRSVCISVLAEHMFASAHHQSESHIIGELRLTLCSEEKKG